MAKKKGKDPAVLFYTSDFITGTVFMSDAEVGKYIRLLCMQHQTGGISEEDMINICGTKESRVWKKFVRNENGLWYNERMRDESEKRKAFCQSRAENRSGTPKPNTGKPSKPKKKSGTYVAHMENENENINEDIIETGVGGLGEEDGHPESQTFFSEYTEYPVEQCLDYYRTSGWEMARNTIAQLWKISPETVLRWAEIFTTVLKTRNQPDKTMADYTQHFASWLKLKADKTNPEKYIENANTTTNNGKTLSAAHAGGGTNATVVIPSGKRYGSVPGNG